MLLLLEAEPITRDLRHWLSSAGFRPFRHGRVHDHHLTGAESEMEIAVPDSLRRAPKPGVSGASS